MRFVQHRVKSTGDGMKVVMGVRMDFYPFIVPAMLVMPIGMAAAVSARMVVVPSVMRPLVVM